MKIGEIEKAERLRVQLEAAREFLQRLEALNSVSLSLYYDGNSSGNQTDVMRAIGITEKETFTAIFYDVLRNAAEKRLVALRGDLAAMGVEDA